MLKFKRLKTERSQLIQQAVLVNWTSLHDSWKCSPLGWKRSTYNLHFRLLYILLVNSLMSRENYASSTSGGIAGGCTGTSRDRALVVWCAVSWTAHRDRCWSVRTSRGPIRWHSCAASTTRTYIDNLYSPYNGSKKNRINRITELNRRK